jgi:ribonuclease HII
MPITRNPVTKVFRQQATEGPGKMARLRKLACSDVYERKLRAQGYSTIAGIDEVGRGCLFGPVVAAAVILPEDLRQLKKLGLRDSKQLTAVMRQELDEVIRSLAIAICIAEVDAATIDRVNIYQASRLAMRQAVEGLSCEPDHLLIDAMRLDHTCAQTKLIYGDSLSLSIAAASVVAKVHRDALMVAYDEEHPQYGFASHKGYGTAQHRKAIQEHGLHEHHRRSFAPVAAVLTGVPALQSVLKGMDDQERIGENLWDEN